MEYILLFKKFSEFRIYLKQGHKSVIFTLSGEFPRNTSYDCLPVHFMAVPHSFQPRPSPLIGSKWLQNSFLFSLKLELEVLLRGAGAKANKKHFFY